MRQRRRLSAAPRAAVAALLVGAFVVTAGGTHTEAASPVSPPVSPPEVVLWGDSLAWEAQDAFATGVTAATDVVVRSRTFGGTALCDWLGDIERTVTHERVTAAVLEFSGNNLTPCMHDPESGAPLVGDRLVGAYTRDLERALAFLDAGGGPIRVYLVGAPPTRGEAPDDPGPRLRELYRRAAASHPGTTYVAAGESVLDDHGGWTATLPCLPSEGSELGCVEGRIPVRAAVGAHFCPAAARAVGGVVDRCTVWSSGAFRFGTAMAVPVGRDLVASAGR